MFCSECGKRIAGKFCSHCGTAVMGELGGMDLVPVEVAPDFDREVRYESILKFPGVREKIEYHARQAAKQMTGEQFLALADKLVPMGVPLEKLAAVVQPLYSRLGIKTGKERAERVCAPVGVVMVRALCSLARHGQALHGVTQAEDGCLLEAALPSDLFSLEGTLLVGVHRSESQTAVSAATKIAGQFFDWGKSKRCLDELFIDLARDAA